MAQIALSSDHAGLALKQELKELLLAQGHQVKDFGAHTTEPVDYPDFGVEVGTAISQGKADFGVCVCGTGIGIAMAANKISGVRAATVYDVTSARLTRQHNNANVACFGQRLTGVETAKEALRVFIETDFEGGRHASRVAKLDAL